VGVPRADPLIGLAITVVILKITWDSWRIVASTEPGETPQLPRARASAPLPGASAGNHETCFTPKCFSHRTEQAPVCRGQQGVNTTT